MTKPYTITQDRNGLWWIKFRGGTANIGPYDDGVEAEEAAEAALRYGRV